MSEEAVNQRPGRAEGYTNDNAKLRADTDLCLIPLVAVRAAGLAYLQAQWLSCQ